MAEQPYHDPEQEASDILERDSLLTETQRKALNQEQVEIYLPFHKLLISKGIKLDPNQIPPCVRSLQTILGDIISGMSDLEEGYEFLEKYGDFDGLGLKTATPEQKKAFLTQLLQDEEVKATIFPEQTD